MKIRLLVLGVALTALGLGTLESAGQAARGKNLVWQPIVSKDAHEELVARCNSIFQRELPNLNQLSARERRKRLKTLRATALFLAALAQSTPEIARDRGLATLRDVALKLYAALDPSNPNLQAANQLTNGLPRPKADPKARLGPVPLTGVTNDREEIMYVFRLRVKGGHGIDPQLQNSPKLRGKGGDGIEEKIKEMTERPLKAQELKQQSEELALLAYKVAAVAQFAEDWTPNIQDAGKKTQKAWRGFSQDMRKFALDLANAAAKGTPQQVNAAAGKLNAVCNRCHGIFK
jgi:cytochrome c556